MFGDVKRCLPKLRHGWLEKFGETPLKEKEDFYSHQNREVLLMQITSTQIGVCKDFEIKNLNQDHELYV